MLARLQTPRVGWAVAILASVLALAADFIALFMPATAVPKAFWPLPYAILLPILVASFAVIMGLVGTAGASGAAGGPGAGTALRSHF